MKNRVYKTTLKKRESNRIWREKYPEKQKKAVKNWYKKNPGRHDKTSKAWRLKNPRRAKKAIENWNKKNPEKRYKATKTWVLKNLEKVKLFRIQRVKSGQSRHDARKYLYGITKDQFQKMIKIQKNKCAICKKVFIGPKAPAVDHNHLTKKIRGLLCSSCNTGLGNFKDSLKYLLQAIKYIRKK